MKNKINNLSDLQNKLKQLKQSCEQQEANLKQDVTSYVKQFTLAGFFSNYIFSKSKDKEHKKSPLGNQLMAVLLPYLLNKTVFKNSSILTKTITTLLTGKFSSMLTIENVMNLVAECKNLFQKKQKSNPLADYGVYS